MPLSQSDTARLYSDAFATNMKTLAGENAFVIADLKTQLDVSKMAASVLQDELDAMTAERDKLKADADQGQIPAANLDGTPAEA